LTPIKKENGFKFKINWTCAFGGGSKGIAHAGAIKFLEEQNIRPTRIAGTSAGAIVGAMYSWERVLMRF
jgi:predicted acylesterase/phospholipase RssA